MMMRCAVSAALLGLNFHFCDSSRLNKTEARWILHRKQEVLLWDAVAVLLDDVESADEGLIAGFCSEAFQELALEDLENVLVLLASDSNSRPARILWLGLALCAMGCKSCACEEALRRIIARDPANLDENNLSLLQDVLISVGARDFSAVGDIFMLNDTEMFDVIEGVFAFSRSRLLIESLIETAARWNKDTLLVDGKAFQRGVLARAKLAKLALEYQVVFDMIVLDPRMKTLVESLECKKSKIIAHRQ